MGNGHPNGLSWNILIKSVFGGGPGHPLSRNLLQDRDLQYEDVMETLRRVLNSPCAYSFTVIQDSYYSGVLEFFSVIESGWHTANLQCLLLAQSRKRLCVVGRLVCWSYGWSCSRSYVGSYGWTLAHAREHCCVW